MSGERSIARVLHPGSVTRAVPTSGLRPAFGTERAELYLGRKEHNARQRHAELSNAERKDPET